MYKNPTPNDIAQSNRITRCCLIGTGIVSGLELALDENQNICVTPGNGITSDGKYFELSRNKIFTFYSEFTEANGYPFFRHADGSAIVCTTWG